MNSDAGAGGPLEVILRIKGEEHLFVIDTGSSLTIFDRSLIALLGSPVQPVSVTIWDQTIPGDLYPTPEIYLDRALLITGPNVVAADCKQKSRWSDRPIVGILGMDCLQNYSLILDFKKRRIRLKEGAIENPEGMEIGLKELGDGCYLVPGGLDGSVVDSLVDTGYGMDGWLIADLFDAWAAKGQWQADSQACLGSGFFSGKAWDGILLRSRVPGPGQGLALHAKVNGIGLRFLARYIATFSFPAKKLYLQQFSPRPPADVHAENVAASVVKEFRKLHRRGGLPGIGKNDRVFGDNIVFRIQSSRSVVLEVSNARSPEIVIHYKFSRAAVGADWTLEETWRKDLPSTID